MDEPVANSNLAASGSWPPSSRASSHHDAGVDHTQGGPSQNREAQRPAQRVASRGACRIVELVVGTYHCYRKVKLPYITSPMDS